MKIRVLTFEKTGYLLTYLINILFIVLTLITRNEWELRNFLGSDFLFFPDLFNDLFVNHGNLNDWTFPGVPLLFPEMATYFLLYAIFKSVPFVALLFSIFQLTLINYLLYRIIKLLMDQVNYYILSISNLILSIIFLASIIDNNFIFTYIFLTPNFHLGAFINCLLSLFLTIKYLQSKKNRILYFLFFISLISTISDKLYIVLFIIPTLCCLLVLFISRKEYKSLKLFFTITISVAFGVLLTRLLPKIIGSEILVGFKLFKVSNILPSFHTFINQLMSYITSFNFAGIFVILTCFSFILHIFFLIKNFKSIHSQNREVFLPYYYMLFSFFFFCIVLVAPIINGIYVDATCLRYNSSAFYLLTFNLIIVTTFLFKKYFFGSLIKILSSFLILSSFIFMIYHFSRPGIQNRLTSYLQFYPKLVECYDTFIKKYPSKRGISGYWYAKVLTNFSKEGAQVLTVYPGLTPNPFICNRQNYYKDNAIFNFVFIDKTPFLFDATLESVSSILGNPLDTFNCDNFILLFYADFKFDYSSGLPYLIKSNTDDASIH